MGSRATVHPHTEGGDLAVAIRYALSCLTPPLRHIEDSTLEIDNNIAERAILGPAVGESWLFARLNAGRQRAAPISAAIEASKFNAIDPKAKLAEILPCLDDHSAKRLRELLQENWRPRAEVQPP